MLLNFLRRFCDLGTVDPGCFLKKFICKTHQKIIAIHSYFNEIACLGFKLVHQQLKNLLSYLRFYNL